jgi:hypothetical protein
VRIDARPGGWSRGIVAWLVGERELARLPLRLGRMIGGAAFHTLLLSRLRRRLPLLVATVLLLADTVFLSHLSLHELQLSRRSLLSTLSDAPLFRVVGGLAQLCHMHAADELLENIV